MRDNHGIFRGKPGEDDQELQFYCSVNNAPMKACQVRLAPASPRLLPIIRCKQITLVASNYSQPHPLYHFVDKLHREIMFHGDLALVVPCPLIKNLKV